jgi:hypothetical protein
MVELRKITHARTNALIMNDLKKSSTLIVVCKACKIACVCNGY